MLILTIISRTLLMIMIIIFFNRLSLSSFGWLQTWGNPSASGFQAQAITLNFQPYILKYNVFVLRNFT